VNKSVRVLSLDLGTKLGFSLFRDGELLEFGCIELRRGSEVIADTVRRMRLFEFLGSYVKKYAPTHMAVEGVNAAIMRGNRQRELHYGDRGVLELFCQMHGLDPLIYVPVGTAKKRLAGNGNAKKPDMIAAAARLGHITDDDNAADALAVGLVAIDLIKGGKTHVEKKTKPKAATAAKRKPKAARADGGQVRL
jgi:Holliday junction resolvasome RuvABC endonuclease subunit